MTVTPPITPLDNAILDHGAAIVYAEKRPFSFKDFLNFEVEGRIYTPKHGSIRNAFYRLAKNGRIAIAYNSGIAFYTLPDQPFNKPPVTPRGYGGRAADHDRIVQNEIEKLPFQERALHDLRLLFTLQGAWDILSGSTEHRLDPTNKDIRLKSFKARNGQTEIRITVHKTDNVSVLLACSYAPIFTDIQGVMRLSNELTRAEDYLISELKAAAKAAGKEIEPHIPDHMGWTCKHFHLGRDSLQEYNSDRFNVSYDDFQGAFVRVYSKAFSDGKRRIRIERLESPNKPLFEVVNNLLDGKEGQTA